MFTSHRRPVVFPQLEHARLSAAIAVAWDDGVVPLPLPRESFVTGVALHDRGYGEHDADGIGAVPRERWLAIQRGSFAPAGVDPVVDLVVAMHVRRLVSHATDDAARAALTEMDEAIPALREAAGVSEADAAMADRITDLCDRVSFDFCLEQPESGSVGVVGPDGEAVAVRYQVDGQGTIVLEPWPLGPLTVSGVVLAYAAESYPQVLEPVVTQFLIEPS
jgi:Protein of unknown function (DUF3891)